MTPKLWFCGAFLPRRRILITPLSRAEGQYLAVGQLRRGRVEQSHRGQVGLVAQLKVACEARPNCMEPETTPEILVRSATGSISNSEILSTFRNVGALLASPKQGNEADLNKICNFVPPLETEPFLSIEQQ